MQEYQGEEQYRDFMNYVIKTTPESYQNIKQNCHDYAMCLLKERIKSAREQFSKQIKTGAPYDYTEGDKIEKRIVNYMYTGDKGIPEPKNGENYTNEEINEIYKDINSTRKMQGKEPLLLSKDERIAAQLSLSYMEELFNDRSFFDFCLKIGAMTPEDEKNVTKIYDPYTKVSYITEGLAESSKAYDAAEIENVLEI